MQTKHWAQYNAFIRKLQALEDPNSRGLHFKHYTLEEINKMAKVKDYKEPKNMKKAPWKQEAP